MVVELFVLGIIFKGGWEIEGVFVLGMKEFYFVICSSKEKFVIVIGFCE